MGASAEDFKDRSRWLVFFGIVQILIGSLLTLLVPLTVASLAFLPRGPAAEAAPVDTRLLVPGVAFYALVGLFFLGVGVGSLKARRWARTLTLLTSWIWLLAGLLMLGLWLVSLPAFDEQMATIVPGASGGLAAAAKLCATALLVILYVLLPGAFVVFYGSRHTKATFEQRDPQTRWTDRCPPSVLGLAAFLLSLALLVLFALFYGALPLFGRVLVGGPAVAAILLASAALVGLAVGIYHLRPSAWWAALLLSALGCASVMTTFLTIDWRALYEQMGLPPELVDLIGRYGVLQGPAMGWLTVGSWVLYVGHLFYIRKYFRRTPAAKP